MPLAIITQIDLDLLNVIAGRKRGGKQIHLISLLESNLAYNLIFFKKKLNELKNNNNVVNFTN